MNNKTYFFRNIKNIQMLEEKSKDKELMIAPKSHYLILAEINLCNDDFIKFSSNLTKNFPLMYKYLSCINLKHINNTITVIYYQLNFKFRKYLITL